MHLGDADGGDEAVALRRRGQGGALAEHRLEAVADVGEADAGALIAAQRVVARLR